jgi:hypothetical protein
MLDEEGQVKLAKLASDRQVSISIALCHLNFGIESCQDKKSLDDAVLLAIKALQEAP